MLICPNPECPARIRLGAPADFPNGVKTCPDCSTALVDSTTFPQSPVRSDSPPSPVSPRQAPVDAQTTPVAARTREIPIRFRGSARDYFKIWIVNLCLTVLTLGIFSAWAKVRKKRYFYSQTILDGTPFQYLGRPVPILKGRIIAAVLFCIYYIASHFVTSLLPYVAVAGFFLAPWILVRSASFNARYSSFRNMTFQFHGTYLDGLKIISGWGLVPVTALVFFFGLRGHGALAAFGGFMIFILSAAFPWWMRAFKNFLISNTSYGKQNATFSAKGGDFFKIYFRSGLIVLAFALLTGLAVALFFMIAGKKSGFSVVAIVMMVPIYAGYILAYAYVQAQLANLVWNNAGIGPVRFRCDMKGWELTKLYLTNALGILVTAGLLIPWAVMRTMTYRAEKITVLHDGDLSAFEGAPARDVNAIGAETGDFFDLDFSL